MSNVEVLIIAEGQTEQIFMQKVLAPYLGERGVLLHVPLLGRIGRKGGNVRFDRAKQDIGNFLKERSNTYVSTMFDYYGINQKWPGRENLIRRIENGESLSAAEKAEALEKVTFDLICESFSEHGAKDRFIPYIAMHEFEALLFSNPEELANGIGGKARKIQKILDNYDGEPEAINGNKATAPSKQIEENCSGAYRKVVKGAAIAKAIGISKMREKCAHFNGWLTKLEVLEELA